MTLTPKEITAALNEFAALTSYLEELYCEGGGEVTPDTEDLEARLASLQELLEQATDDLGRWLKSKEDEAKTYKAEKDHAARRQKGAEGSVEFIKGLIREVLDRTGKTACKGTLGYKFTAYDSTTTTADKEAIRNAWQGVAEEALRKAGVPAWITVTLGASSSLVPEGEDLPDVFQVSKRATVKFTKPRSSNGKAEEN